MTPREFGAEVGRAYAEELQRVAEAAFRKAFASIASPPDDLPRDDETLVEVIVGFTSAFTSESGMSSGARVAILEHLALTRPDLMSAVERALSAMSS